MLRMLGAEPVACDVFHTAALTGPGELGPDLVFHQLTDLPERVEDIPSFGERDNRIHGEGTRNLLVAAAAAGCMELSGRPWHTEFKRLGSTSGTVGTPVSPPIEQETNDARLRAETQPNVAQAAPL